MMRQALDRCLGAVRRQLRSCHTLYAFALSVGEALTSEDGTCPVCGKLSCQLARDLRAQRGRTPRGSSGPWSGRSARNPMRRAGQARRIALSAPLSTVPRRSGQRFDTMRSSNR
jgi:hypothetical protein